MKFSKILLFLGLLGIIAAAAVSAPGPARASLLTGLFAKKQAVVPLNQIYPVQTEDDFQGVAKSFHGTPYNDPQLEFEIMLPKDWGYEETAQIHDKNELTRELLGDLAKFRSPVINTMQAIVTVQSIKLDHEISAENWLKNYILSNNYDLQDAVSSVNERKASASCISTINGSSSYIYISVQFNGNNAVVVRFESPLALKDALAFVRKKIVDSFRFILDTDRPIEVLKSFNFADGVKFRYPASLIMNHVDIKDSRHMSIQFYNQRAMGKTFDQNRVRGPQIDGYIRFDVIRRSTSTSFRKEADDLKTFIDQQLGLEFKKLISSDKAPVPDRFIFSRYEIYQVSLKKGGAIDQELRLVALGDKNWYIFAILLSPTSEENFYAWAVNTQDYDMIVKDFR